MYMLERLMDAILDWPTPRSVHEIRHFMGLTNIYLCFIYKYGAMVQPISKLLRCKRLECDESQESSFAIIKGTLITASILSHLSPEKRFAVSTGPSKYVVGATLDQDNHPIARMSHLLSEGET